ncbi:hypothetical protein fHeYen901_119 [Yersinia phage fHe-Yen9-01]|uniref:T4 y05I-like putative transcription factor C-terminal domain-containing protein n=1 Tax=Yersinia phage fHe-Yen9-01 TaxID=1965363 RepID=A0A1V0DXL4_9CAUD|nr:hypothetical protein KNT60_gp118 [Yersinia phage fHe-Yen9-01]ARB05892.1 hypothetical protein fHeYen901_119 [Yersinia phage fHe-Yen9-01]
MSLLTWAKHRNATIVSDISSCSPTILSVEITSPDTVRDLIHLRQDDDYVAFTKAEASALLSYLSAVIPTMDKGQ